MTAIDTYLVGVIFVLTIVVVITPLFSPQSAPFFHEPRIVIDYVPVYMETYIYISALDFYRFENISIRIQDLAQNASRELTFTKEKTIQMSVSTNFSKFLLNITVLDVVNNLKVIYEFESVINIINPQPTQSEKFFEMNIQEKISSYKIDDFPVTETVQNRRNIP